VLPVPSKLLERVVLTQVSVYLDHLDFVLDAMDGQKLSSMLFHAISKAFDSVNHKILLGKLEYVGLSARSLR